MLSYHDRGEMSSMLEGKRSVGEGVGGCMLYSASVSVRGVGGGSTDPMITLCSVQVESSPCTLCY
jgi:hypothetical protein